MYFVFLLLQDIIFDSIYVGELPVACKGLAVQRQPEIIMKEVLNCKYKQPYPLEKLILSIIDWSLLQLLFQPLAHNPKF